MPEALSFSLCFVHHPASDWPSGLRSKVYKHYRRDPQRNLGDGGLGLEVEYRSDTASGSNRPIPVDYDRSEVTAVVVIFDRELAEDADFCRYVGELAQDAVPKFPRISLLAVTFDDAGVRAAHGYGIEDWQTLDATKWVAADRERRLFTAIDHHFCRILTAYRAKKESPTVDEAGLRKAFMRKAQIFLSHSKHDPDKRGENIAKDLRVAFYDMGTDPFFDVTNLPSGTPWQQILDDAASGHALVAILTDSYSSRTWCRKEVLAAKRAGMPILVANCLEDFEVRSFPYLGNAPVIQMMPDVVARQSHLIGRLFDEMLRDIVWRCHTLGPSAGVIFQARAPELMALAYIERQIRDGDAPQVTLIYPGAPLGEEEKELFKTAAPHVRLETYVSWKAGLVV